MHLLLNQTLYTVYRLESNHLRELLQFEVTVVAVRTVTCPWSGRRGPAQRGDWKMAGTEVAEGVAEAGGHSFTVRRMYAAMRTVTCDVWPVDGAEGGVRGGEGIGRWMGRVARWAGRRGEAVALG